MCASDAAIAARRAQPIEDRGAIAAEQATIIADLAARRTRTEPVEESARDRFMRALELEARQQRGDRITVEQERWLSVYQHTAEYQAEAQMKADFGDAYLG